MVEIIDFLKGFDLHAIISIAVLGYFGIIKPFNKKFEKIDQRFEKLEGKISALDSRLGRIDGMLSFPTFLEFWKHERSRDENKNSVN